MLESSDQTDKFKIIMKDSSFRDAFQGIMKYFKTLYDHIRNDHPEYKISGRINYGMMDYTYFHFTTDLLKKQGLKIVVLFEFDSFNIEAWLSGINKRKQIEFWEKFNQDPWKNYHISSDIKSDYYIVRDFLVENADFQNTDELTNVLLKKLDAFTQHVEDSLLTK